VTSSLSPADVAAAFVAACRAELTALKPGNVHVHSAGHGMDAARFEASAEAAAPFVADPASRVGARVRRAVEATFGAAGLNTNLGILLLCAPLAAAADSPSLRLREEGPGEELKRGARRDPAAPPGLLPVQGEREESPERAPRPDSASPYGAKDLRLRLSRVLDGLDVQDSADAFAAIARANPAGLGRAEAEDVSRPPALALKAAMALAADRDRIARAYATDFADVFEIGLPVLGEARALAGTPDLAVTTLHMTFLAAFEDSHILRKHGRAAAAQVRREAQGLEPLWSPVATPASFAALLDFDRDLKARGLNPGTTADLVVASLFAESLSSRLASASKARA